MDERPLRTAGSGRDVRHGPSDVVALGVDIGTTNTKAALVTVAPDASDDDAVRVLRTGGVPTSDDPAALVAAVASLVRRVLADAPRPPAVVGLASMAETGVPLDAEGDPLRTLLRWDGQRGSAEAQALAASLGRDMLFTATGVRPAPKVPLVTWAWLRAHEPGVWAGMRRWAGAADLVCHALTGRLATDHTLAGRTMAYRLPDADGVLPPSFDADLLAAVGLSPEQLPDIVGPGDVAGRVNARAFLNAGLTAGTPVVIAGHDHAVGAYAAGVRAPGDVADSLGTAEAVITVLTGRPAPGPVAAAGMSVVRTVSGRYDALVAGSPSAGAMVAWWLATMACGRPAAEVFGEVFNEVFDAVADAPSEPTGILVLPYLTGRQAPAPDPAATVEIRGATAEHGTAHLTRALLEGVSLHARWMLVEQARLGGTHLSDAEIAVLGSAAVANPAWMRVKAAVTPAPLRLVDIAEPVAAGAALVAAERAGLLPGTVPRLPGRPGTGGGEPSQRTAYDRMFADFVAAAVAGRPRLSPVPRRSRGPNPLPVPNGET